MRRYNGVRGLFVNGLKVSMGFLIFFALTMVPLDSAYAQVSLDQQFMEATEDLTLEAKVELIGLLRDPGDLGEALEEFGISPGLADRLEGSLANERELRKIDQVSAKIGRIDDRLEAKLANIKADKIIEIAAKEAAKAEETVAKVGTKAAADAEKAAADAEKAAADAAKAAEDAAKAEAEANKGKNK